MNEKHNLIIISLLVAILAVLLFGRSAIMDFISYLPWVLLALVVICVAVGLLLLTVRTIKNEVKENDSPALLQVICYVSFFGNYVVGGLAAYMAWHNGETWAASVNRIPFSWLPIAFFLGSYGAILGISYLRNKKKSPSAIKGD